MNTLPRVLKEMCFEVRIGNSFLNLQPFNVCCKSCFQLPSAPTAIVRILEYVMFLFSHILFMLCSNDFSMFGLLRIVISEWLQIIMIVKCCLAEKASVHEGVVWVDLAVI